MIIFDELKEFVTLSVRFVWFLGVLKVQNSYLKTKMIEKIFKMEQRVKSY